MRKWLAVALLSLAAAMPAEAALIEFNYELFTQPGGAAGSGSFNYDFTDSVMPVSDFEAGGAFWPTVGYNNFVSSGSKFIRITATRGNSFLDLSLRSLDLGIPDFPQALSLDDFDSGILIMGSRLNPAPPVYRITALGESTAVPLPAALWLFACALPLLALRLKPVARTLN